MREIFEKESYAGQCFFVICGLAPLVALSLIYGGRMSGVAAIVAALFLLGAIGSMFLKNKECPRPMRDIIYSLITTYLFFVLPPIIAIYAGSQTYVALWFGLGMMAVSLISCLLDEKQRRETTANIETVQAMKSEAADHSQLVESLFEDKWKVVNKLCKIYYEKSESTGAMKLIVRDIEEVLKGLQTPESIADILATTDRCLNGAITQLREECPFLKEQDIEFIGLIHSGLSVRAVCYICDLRKANYYQKKNRLMSRIAESDAPHKQLFIERLAKFTR